MAVERFLETKPILLKVFAHSEMKIWATLLFSFFFDIGKEPELVAIFALIILDFLTGVSASRYRGAQIKSAKIFRTVVKILTYFGSISAGFLLEKAIHMNVGADEVLFIFLGATEFISILENLARLGFKAPEILLKMAEDIKNNPDKHK